MAIGKSEKLSFEGGSSHRVSCSSLSRWDDQFDLDFGCVPLGETSSLEVAITNLTDIESTVTASIAKLKTRVGEQRVAERKCQSVRSRSPRRATDRVSTNGVSSHELETSTCRNIDLRTHRSGHRYRLSFAPIGISVVASWKHHHSIISHQFHVGYLQ